MISHCVAASHGHRTTGKGARTDGRIDGQTTRATDNFQSAPSRHGPLGRLVSFDNGTVERRLPLSADNWLRFASNSFRRFICVVHRTVFLSRQIAKRLEGKSDSKMTYYMSSETLKINLKSMNQSINQSNNQSMS